jgi:hypothetical protein
MDTKHELRRGKSLPYAWDAPGSNRRVMLSMMGREREVDLGEIGQLVPLKLRLPDRTEVVSMEVKAQGPTIMLVLDTFDPTSSSYHQRSADDVSADAFVVVRVVEVREGEGRGEDLGVTKRPACPSRMLHQLISSSAEPPPSPGRWVNAGNHRKAPTPSPPWRPRCGCTAWASP